MAFLDECRGCYEGGVCYCTGIGMDTRDHLPLCHTRITRLDEHGSLDFTGCAVGCLPCKDHPSDIILQAAARRPEGGGLPRFLLPFAQDARGKLHELQAGIPHLAQRTMDWKRAANHNNYGYECLGPGEGKEITHYRGPIDAPCAVWPWNEWPHVDTVVCDHGEPPGAPIQGLFGEGFFYSGGWPPTIHCRRFPDAPLASFRSISLDGNTVFMNSAATKAHPDVGCVTDWLVPGAGWITHGSPCWGAFQYVHRGTTPEQDDPSGPYAGYLLGGGTACATLFDKIVIHNNNTSFVAREGVDPHDVDLHNAILAKVRRPGLFEGVEFDKLDHEAREGGNSSLGRFSRSWEGANLEGYSGITDSRLPVVRSYPESRTRWYDLPASVELVIVKVWMVLDLALPHVKENVSGGRNDYVEPHCVARIHVWLGLRVTVEDNEHDVQADYTASPHWPDITSTPTVPDGNSLLIAQEPGEWRQPPASIEWRGVLNNFSSPSLEDQGYRKMVGPTGTINSGYAAVLKWVCRRLGTWHVPGAPVHLDHNPDAPNQHWGGGISFTFRDMTHGSSYLQCNPL